MGVQITKNPSLWRWLFILRIRVSVKGESRGKKDQLEEQNSYVGKKKGPKPMLC